MQNNFYLTYSTIEIMEKDNCYICDTEIIINGNENIDCDCCRHWFCEYCYNTYIEEYIENMSGVEEENYRKNVFLGDSYDLYCPCPCKGKCLSREEMREVLKFIPYDD